MRAALIREPGSPPEFVEDHPEPQGELVVDVTAAPLNPVDLSIASGKFYAGPPNAPYVPGVEGAGVNLLSYVGPGEGPPEEVFTVDLTITGGSAANPAAGDRNPHPCPSVD